MSKIVKLKRANPYDDEIDESELGAETEAEKHLKTILQKQLKTEVSIQEQFSQHRTFVCPSTQTTLQVSGSCTLKELRSLEQRNELKEQLQRCGLSSNEIEMYLVHKERELTEKSLINPAVLEEAISKIEAKIMSHNEELLKPQVFSNVKKLTRHEMDLEKALYSGCNKKVHLSALVSTQDNNGTNSMDDTFKHIKTLSDRLINFCKKKRKKGKKEKNKIEEKDLSSESEEVEYDSNIHHVIVPVEEDEVVNNRLSLEQIQELPRFSNYTPGIPNKVLYIKNLHNKTTPAELRSLFGRFEEIDSFITYKICTGRMKGQAFVTFPNAHIAEQALNFANGYQLRGKPIVIEFGKQR